LIFDLLIILLVEFYYYSSLEFFLLTLYKSVNDNYYLYYIFYGLLEDSREFVFYNNVGVFTNVGLDGDLWNANAGLSNKT
jgi:hypothetical protein